VLSVKLSTQWDRPSQDVDDTERPISFTAHDADGDDNYDNSQIVYQPFYRMN